MEATTAALLALEAIFTDVARSAEEDEQPGMKMLKVVSILLEAPAAAI